MGPALVLVHGSASVSLSWPPVLPALSRDFTVYAMDRRGRLPSGDGEKYSMQAEMDDVAAVVDAAGPPVILVAHSYGAVVAAAAAARGDRLKNVSRMILYEPPAYEKPRPEHARMVEEMNRAWDAGDRDQLAAIFIGGVLGLSPPALATYRASPAWAGITALAGTLKREAEAVGTFPASKEDLAKWKVPTTMLLGSQSPAYMGDAARFVCGAMANCHLVMLEGQGHMAPQLAPALFVSKVLEAAGK